MWEQFTKSNLMQSDRPDSSYPGESKDHDILITLVTKVDQLTLDIRDLKTDLITRVAKAEARLDANDVFHAAIPLKDYDEIARWAGNLRANFKLIIIVGGVIVSILASVLSKLIGEWLHI